MSKNNSTQGANGIAEIPREAIIEACKSYSDVKLRIRRNSSRGHWATVTGSIMMPTRELLDIDDWLREQAGGGNFRIDTTDPQDASRVVIKPFMVRIEGPERNFNGGQGDDPGGYSGSYPAGAPQHFQSPGGRPSLPRNDPRNDPANPRNFMARTPDQIASEGWNESRRERDEERRGRHTERKAHEDEQRKMRGEMDRLREQMAETARVADRKALEAKIEALQNQKTHIDWAPLVIGVAPIVIAMIEASGKRSAETIAASASREGSSLELTKAMIASQGNSDGALDQLMKLAPLAMPLVTRILDQKDPSKMADLYATVSDAQMTSAALQAQLFQSLNEGQGGEPAWMPIVTTLGQAAEDLAAAMMKQAGSPEIVSAPPPGAQPAGPGAAAQPAQPGQPPQPPPEGDARVAAMNQIMDGLPPYLHSQEWANIVYHLIGEVDAVLPDLAEAIMVEVTRSGAEELVAVQNDLTAIQGAFLDRVQAVCGPLGMRLSPEYQQKVLQEMIRQATSPAQPAATEAPQEAPQPNGSNGRPRPSGMLVGDEIPPEARINRGAPQPS